MEQYLSVAAIVGAVVGVAALSWGISSYFARKRREAWQAVAQQTGLAFLPDAQGVRDRLSGFKICNLGHSRKAINSLVGQMHGFEVTLFDYRYTTGSGKNRRVHNQTLCAVRHPSLRLPHFFVRRQLKLWDALGKVFGGQDINFDEDPAFSRSFVLQGEDEAAVRRAFSDHARGYFSKFQASSLQFEALADTLLVNNGKRIKPADGLAAIEQAISIGRIWTE